MHQLFVLYEDAMGYALFRTSEFEEIGTFLPIVQDSVLDLNKFRSVVSLVAFQQFETWREGLENVKCVASGSLHKSLKLFLESNMPKPKTSKQGVMLGVQDPGLASVISETMGLNCTVFGAMNELIRGIRFHFRGMLRTFTNDNVIKRSKLAMSHHYSRSKVNLTVNKVDSMITHGLGTVNQLNKNINSLVCMIRKIYGVHFPELFKIIPEDEKYLKSIKQIKNRRNLPANIGEVLQNILKHEHTVETILKSAQNSMGMDISEDDMESICNMVNKVLSLINQKNNQCDYLKIKMRAIAPSLGTVLGEIAGARLIADAGSLTKLAKYPSSTLQVLGARKAIFRTWRSKKSTTKFSGKKGVINKFLANKCCLAAKIDCFGDYIGPHSCTISWKNAYDTSKGS